MKDAGRIAGDLLEASAKPEPITHFVDEERDREKAVR